MAISARPFYPYSAVLVASYGGPEKPEDVLPFMRNATAGRGVPDERLVEVSQHYMLFGGKSPINDENRALMDALRGEFTRRGLDIPVVIGNRNWHPFHAATVAELVAAGHSRVLGLPTSAYHCYSSCRQYGEDLQRAMEHSADSGHPIQIDRIAPFAETDGFIQAQIDVATEAFRAMREQDPDGKIRVLFSTHSIPHTMNEASGDGAAGSSYREQHLRVAERVATGLQARAREQIEWELVYNSRSGPAFIPWLEPDVNDVIEGLPAQGFSSVVIVPIGFISAHMEVVFDLDTEARATAAATGIGFIRADTVGTHPAFIAMLADRLLERAAVARGDASPEAQARYATDFDCCHLRAVETSGAAAPSGAATPARTGSASPAAS